MTEWYALNQIRFTGEEIIWVLCSAGLLHEGDWPPEPMVSGDIPTIKKGGKKNARFTKPVEVIAEVERRLEHCGFDGLLVNLYHAYEWDEIQLSKYYRISVAEVRQRIDAVVWWISGWNFNQHFPYRRWHVYRDYVTWKSQRGESKEWVVEVK